MSTTALLKDIVNGLTVSEAPRKREMIGEWVEAVCAIGKDEIAYITMPKEAYEELLSKEWE